MKRIFCDSLGLAVASVAAVCLAFITLPVLTACAGSGSPTLSTGSDVTAAQSQPEDPSDTDTLYQSDSETAPTDTEPAPDTDSETEPNALAESGTEPEEETETDRVPNGNLAFLPHDDVLYPYIDDVRAYLEAGADAEVRSFNYRHDYQGQDIVIGWTLEGADIDGYVLEVATKNDYSDAITVTLKPNVTSYVIPYPLRDTTYYLRLCTTGTDVLTSETAFSTPYLGPRFLNVGGLYTNVRDLGGYRVGDKTVLYDMVIRGSSPDNCSDPNSKTFSRAGLTYLQSTVGIKTQLDLRGKGENCGRKTSTFKNADYVQIPLTAYAACFSASQAEYYRQVFSLLADRDSYPVYVHCAGGADRTGTVCALLLALIGVDRDEIIQDYVVTTFTPVCASQDARARESITPVLDGLDAFDGDTLSEKTAEFLLSVGVTREEIFRIRAIMLGDDPDSFVSEPDYNVTSGTHFYSTRSGADCQLTLNEEHTVGRFEIDGVSVPFTQNGKKLTVDASSLAGLTDGPHSCRLTFENGAKAFFKLHINYVDLTDEIWIDSTTKSGCYTNIVIRTKTPAFDGIDYHFHTKSGTDFPEVENHIAVNGRTLADLNANENMSGYNFTSSPGSTDARHRVPVSVYAEGNSIKLLVHTQWFFDYATRDGGSYDQYTVTVKPGLTFENAGITYRVSSNIKFVYKNGVYTRK